MKQLSARGTMAATCLSFFGLGIIVASFGPALPNLAANASSSLATLGGIFTAFFLGGLLSQLLAGPLNDRFGQRPVIFVGTILMALGTIGLTVSHALALMLACTVLAGLGQGALVVSMNLLVAEVFAARSAAALNLLNVFFGIGAITGPAVASLTLGLWGTALPALWLGAALVLVQAPLAWLLLTAAHTTEHVAERADQSAITLRSPLLWISGLMLFLYVGGEIGMGGWTATYLERTTAVDAATAALATAGFWLALTGGRMLGAILSMRTTPNRLLLLCLLGALIGGILLVSSTGSAIPTTAAVLLLGLCFGPIFPTAFAILARTFRRAPGTAVSVAMALGSFGGMLLPWTQGVLLERSGPQASVMQVALCTLAMLIVFLGREALASRTSPAARYVGEPCDP